MNCKYCGKVRATNTDYLMIPEGAGTELCWRDWGGECIDAEDALDNALLKIKNLEREIAKMRALA